MSGRNEFWNSLNILIAKCCWVIIHWTSKNIPTRSNKIPDLCPTDEAENVEEYIDRLQEMLDKRSDTVREIAITAPYSGGKSSLINTFKKRNPNNKYTCISLASFKDTDDHSDNTNMVVPVKSDPTAKVIPSNTKLATVRNDEHLNKIEKSIVQQILYRADSSDTPNSRFRRIYPAPLSYSHALMTAIATILWLSIFGAMIYVSDFKIGTSLNDIIKYPVFSNINLWLLSYFISLPILVFRDGYKLVHKHKITKLNPIKGEVAFEQQTKDSIFNIYLEEIIYYFSTTKSNVVIFEDLDRFERTDIFIKLKELNKLVNDCIDVKQSVRFIYALKDDVFEGKNRTKFFDTIIPVIPIINTANSYPQIKKLLEKAEFIKDFSDSYLRDISVYIDDMRILKNIISEYSIYKNTLTIDLTLEKLFSFMLYKNIYCDDFAKLHDHKGILADVFKNTRKIKQSKEEKLTEQLESLEQKLIDSERELTSSLQELNSHYLLTVMEKTHKEGGITHINDKSIYEIPKPEFFDQLFANNSPFHFNIHQRQHRSSFAFNSLINDMVPSYKVRKKRILNKNDDRQQELKKEIRNLIKKLDSNKNISLRELASGTERGEIFKDAENKTLLIHMVEKGYIDKDYHIYMTHHIEGGITKNDMEFVISVKDNKPLDRSVPINNCEETLKFLTTDDEYKSFAFFNYDIIDHLISIDNYYPLRALINNGIKKNDRPLVLIAESFSQIEEKSLWLKIICGEWNDIWTDVVTTSEVAALNKSELLVQMLIEADINDDKYQLENNKSNICRYISENEDISGFFPVKEESREKLILVFRFLGVIFQTLSDCKDATIFMRHILKHQMFDVNIENLKIVLNSIGADVGGDTLSYTYLLLIKDSHFSRIINEKIDDIAQLIALGYIAVSQEQEMLDLLNNQYISINVKQDLIINVDFQLSNLQWLESDKDLLLMLENKRVQPNWLNVIFLHNNEEVEENFLIDFISDTSNAQNICEQKYEFSDDEFEEFSNVIIKDKVSLDAFIIYINYFGCIYPACEFENIPVEKLRYLIVNNHISVDIESYNSLKAINNDLSSLFLSEKFSHFVENNLLLGEVSIDSDDFYALLETKNLSRSQKISLINSRNSLIEPSFDNEYLINNLVPSSTVSRYKPDNSIPKIPTDKLFSLLEQLSDDDRRKEVFTWQLQFLDESNVTTILSTLDKEFLDLPDAKSYIFVAKTAVNDILSKALEYHGYISSITNKEAGFFGTPKIKINVKRRMK